MSNTIIFIKMFKQVIVSSALLTVFVTDAQRVCRSNQYDTQVKCEAIGCLWDGSCKQPLACGDLGNDFITYDGESTGVRVERHPVSPTVAHLCDADVECSAKYVLTLSGRYVTGEMCNDLGALPPHGVDQTKCTETDSVVYPATQMDNYVGHPFPTDGVKQSVAREARSVTALTESGEECTSSKGNGTNAHCAFPLGFKSDIIVKNLGVCVEVRGVQDKWVEIMAQSKEGSNGGSFCALNRNSQIDSESGCTVNGDLIVRMDSGISDPDDTLKLMFVAQDNKDDSEIGILWRIVASHVKSTNGEVAGEDKDAEDWTLYRSGGDYPAALMAITPENYSPDPVYEESTGSSASFAAPSLLLVAALAVFSVFFA